VLGSETCCAYDPNVGLEERLDALSSFATTSHWSILDALDDLTLPGRRIECPLCGHVATRDGYAIHTATCRFGGGRLERYGCPACDLVFGPLKVLDASEALLTADYRLLYETYREARPTASEMRAFRSTSPREGGLYLDWGCGAQSETIDVLREEGWDVWGYEPAVEPQSPFIAPSRGGISARFAGIFSNNVIEHFRDPVAEFEAMASHLEPGGLMTHATPCYELLYTDTRFHTAFYLGRSVDVLARRTGLEVVGRERDGEYMSVTFTT
jgi:hypothetical protein